MRRGLHDLSQSIVLVEHQGRTALARGGTIQIGEQATAEGGPTLPLLGFAPPLDPAQLGDPTFCRDYQVRFPYMTGSMANGIASVELVQAMATAGMLGAYGAAGQRIEVIRAAIDRLQESVGDRTFAFNLIHSPNEPAHEMRVVELYLEKTITLIEASAYLDLTLPVVRYRITGLCRDAAGTVVAPNRIIAKASRVEVASRWFAPPPRKIVDELLTRGHITREEADLSRHIPMAQDLTAEADSGGHTDNRPAITLIPTFLALRDRLQREHGFDPRDMPLRVGAGGGIATPASAAAAFAMGAAYIVTGSINQACVESGSSDTVRKMLAAAEQADTIMAPAADMFEMGVKLQVLKRGTMFAMRAQKCFELYRAYPSIDAIPPAEKANIEKTIFRATLEEVWSKTRDFFQPFDPAQVEKAERDPKHKMALVFRWYLGLSSRWANAGEPTRQMDYQVWCGPAMGAFNEWTRGTFLERPENRKAAGVAMNLMHGAAIMTRVNMLRAQGVRLSDEVTRVEPREMEET
jgi:PfaD family protein